MTKIEIRPGQIWTDGIRRCQIITVADKVCNSLDLFEARVVVYSLEGTPDKSKALMRGDFLQVYRPALPCPVKYRLEFSGDCERFSSDSFDSIQEALDKSFEYFADYKSEEDNDDSYLCRKDWTLDDSEITFEVYEQHDPLRGDDLSHQNLIESMVDQTETSDSHRKLFRLELGSVLDRYCAKPDYRNPVRYIVQDGKPVKA